MLSSSQAAEGEMNLAYSCILQVNYRQEQGRSQKLILRALFFFQKLLSRNTAAERSYAGFLKTPETGKADDIIRLV
jgi:hypothetical protein